MIARYGAKAINDAVKERTKPRRGRPPEGDWLQLDEVLKEDALLWLEGGDPFAQRSNTSIAQCLADEHPGQSHSSTHRRIMRKLSKKRVYYTLILAEQLSQNQWPYPDNLRALRALAESCELDQFWPKRLRSVESSVFDYTCKFGPPSESLSMQEVEIGAVQSLSATPAEGHNNVLQVLLGRRP